MRRSLVLLHIAERGKGLLPLMVRPCRTLKGIWVRVGMVADLRLVMLEVVLLVVSLLRVPMGIWLIRAALRVRVGRKAGDPVGWWSTRLLFLTLRQLWLRLLLLLLVRRILPSLLLLPLLLLLLLLLTLLL